MTRTKGQFMEDAFFRKLEVDLTAELRRRETEETQEKVLSELSGITNEVILHQLIAQDIHAEELAAFLLIPILEVVWADGEVQPAERDVVLHAVEEAGIQKDSVAFQLTQQWLERRPEPELMKLWTDYTRELMGQLTPDAQECIRGTVLEHARAVAAAAGGFLGLGQVSSEEEEVLRALEEAFDVQGKSTLPSDSASAV
jgi:uncharacterized membrane protein YheB (UPF0754 family)